MIPTIISSTATVIGVWLAARAYYRHPTVHVMTNAQAVAATDQIAAEVGRYMANRMIEEVHSYQDTMIELVYAKGKITVTATINALDPTVDLECHHDQTD